MDDLIMKLIFKIYLYVLIPLVLFFIFISRNIIADFEAYQIAYAYSKEKDALHLDIKELLFKKIKEKAEINDSDLLSIIKQKQELFKPSWQLSYCLTDSAGNELQTYTITENYLNEGKNYSPSKRKILNILKNIALKASANDYDTHFGAFYTYSYKDHDLKMHLLSVNLFEKQRESALKIYNQITSADNIEHLQTVKLKVIFLFKPQDVPQLNWQKTDTISAIHLKFGDISYIAYDWISQNILYYSRLKDNRILLIFQTLKNLDSRQYLSINKIDYLTLIKSSYIEVIGKQLLARDYSSGFPIFFYRRYEKGVLLFFVFLLLCLLIFTAIYIAFKKIREGAKQISMISMDFIENNFERNIKQTIWDYLNSVFNHIIHISRHLLKPYQLDEIDEGLEKSIIVIDNALNELMENKRKEAVYQTQLELKKEELERAREIQLSMLPKDNIRLNCMEIVGKMVTATEVGGDFYDYFKIDKNRYCIAWGDATGHGVGAGLVVGMVKSALRSMINRFNKNIKPAEILERLNILLKESITQRTIGMGLGLALINIKTAKIEISSMGLPLPYYYQKNGDILKAIELKGPPLGFISRLSADAEAFMLAHNSFVIFTTDGFEERMNGSNDFWDIDNFEKSLRKNCAEKGSAEDLIAKVFEDCEQFSGGRKNIDDMTMVVLHWK